MKSILRNKFNKLSSLSSELLKNTFLFGIGTIGSKLILFMLVPLYSSYMTTGEFGNADLITSTITLLYPIFSLGIEQSIIRYGLTQIGKREDVIRISLNICLIGGLIFSCISIIVNVFIKLPYLLFIISLYFVIALSTVLESYVKVKELNKLYALNSILKALVLCIINIITLGYLNMGVLGYLLSVVLANIFTIIFLGYKCSIVADYLKGKQNNTLMHNMLSYSIPLVPNTISWWITQISDRYLVRWISGDVINGLYTMAYKIPSVFNLIVSVFSQSLSLTVIKQIDANKDTEVFSKIYRNYIAISFISGSIVIELTRLLAQILLKREFYSAWVYIPMLIYAYVIGNLQAFYGSLFTGLKKSKDALRTTVCGAITNIVLNFTLIPQFEAYGAALATIVSYLVIYIYRMLVIKKSIPFNHQLPSVFISLVLMAVQVYIYEQSNGVLLQLASMIVILIFIIIYLNDIKSMILKAKQILATN